MEIKLPETHAEIPSPWHGQEGACAPGLGGANVPPAPHLLSAPSMPAALPPCWSLRNPGTVLIRAVCTGSPSTWSSLPHVVATSSKRPF